LANKELICNSLDDLPAVAKQIIDFGSNTPIWLFLGEMGAGKTTLIKQIGDIMHVVDQVSSPTFAIVNEYITRADQIIYHFDFYRLESVEEAIEIGAEEYFFSGNLCLIEWPQIIADLLPDHYMTIEVEELLSGQRKIILSHHG
jgi:tRNA threonylcarbamoyladenosine biosynthesis protein TsaE